MIQTCKAWLLRQQDFILVTVSHVEGSSPRETGALLVVSQQDILGTIGGGRLEWDAIAEARDMLKSGQIERITDVVLGPAIGQCCGGKVTLHFKRGNADLLAVLDKVEKATIATRSSVYIYGSGHVGRALASALAPLPLRVLLIDSRRDELDKCHAKPVEKRHTDAPISIAEQAPSDSAHVVMTHSHTLDSLIAGAILERGDFCYLGIIGSKTKRASFRKAFLAMGITKPLIDRVICPIGGNSLADKRPEVIAALTAAEIIVAVLK